MRFATLQVDGAPAWGAVRGDEVELIRDPPTLKAAIERRVLDEAAASTGGRRIRVGEAEWLPVITDPAKIICVGLNYEKHRVETGRDVVGHPTIFTRFADSQLGHRRDLHLPLESDSFDYEGELAVVVGRPGRRIARADALNHVAGYSCYNDASVRDWQAHSIQFIPGKNWPGTGAFGPWLVTPDAFGALGPQRLQTRLNGQVMQDACLSDMIFPVDRLIEYVSTFTPLNPGDVIVSGTPGGVGAKRVPPVFMKAGDVVEVEIDGIGVLSNRVARQP